MTWEKGRSGNPKGRTPGSGKHTQLRKQLESHSAELVDKVIELAMEGDTTALKLCVERVLPARPGAQCVALKVPEGSTFEQAKAVCSSMFAGKVSLDAAQQMLSALSAQAHIEEFTELRERVEALEVQHNDDDSWQD